MKWQQDETTNRIKEANLLFGFKTSFRKHQVNLEYFDTSITIRCNRLLLYVLQGLEWSSRYLWKDSDIHHIAFSNSHL